jgi:hypothetical protein
MASTRKKYNNKKTKKRGKPARSCNCSSNGNNRSAKMTEIFNKNKKRNRMIRNIRMGRSTFSRIYGGQSLVGPPNGFEGGKKQCGGGSSPFVGAPWNPSGNPNTGNFFALSPNGVGTGLDPKLDDGQPLPPGNARFPTQLGPQMRGGNKAYRSRSKKHRGGGIVNDFNSLVANASYKLGSFNSELDGVNPPPNPNPYDQPIQRM